MGLDNLSPINRSIVAEQDRADSEGFYSPDSPSEGRERVFRGIAVRRGQRLFRERLLDVYGRRCCVTGTESEDVLEAAHIQPYSKFGVNSVKNGLLLRSDIHVLFDLQLLSIDPSTTKVYCSEQIRRVSTYAPLHGRQVNFPSVKEMQPDFNILRTHFEGRLA